MQRFPDAQTASRLVRTLIAHCPPVSARAGNVLVLVRWTGKAGGGAHQLIIDDIVKKTDCVVM